MGGAFPLRPIPFNLCFEFHNALIAHALFSFSFCQAVEMSLPAPQSAKLEQHRKAAQRQGTLLEHHLLPDLLYDAILVSLQENNKGRPLGDMVRCYLHLCACHSLPTKVQAIMRTACVTLVLQTAAADLSTTDAAGKVDFAFPSDEVLRVVEECLEVSLLHQQFFLAHISSDNARFLLLQNQPLLQKLGLMCWQIPKDVVNIPSHLFPFQVDETSERGQAYAAVVAAMRASILPQHIVSVVGTKQDAGSMSHQALMRL